MRKRGIALFVVLLAIGLYCGCCGIRPPRREKNYTRSMLVTGYCKCGQCCGWKRNWLGKPVYAYGKYKGKRKRVGITANGERAHVGTIAADTSRYPFGTKMYIPGYGYGIVQDRGGDIKGDHIDLYFTSHGRANHWGRKNLRVDVWLPRK